MMKLNITTFILIAGIFVFAHTSYKEKKCKNFQTDMEAFIMNKTVNLIHICPVDSARCVNNAVLFKEEQTELLIADMKDMGCK